MTAKQKQQVGKERKERERERDVTLQAQMLTADHCLVVWSSLMSCGLQQQHSRSRQHSIIVSRQHSRIQHSRTGIIRQRATVDCGAMALPPISGRLLLVHWVHH